MTRISRHRLLGSLVLSCFAAASMHCGARSSIFDGSAAGSLPATVSTSADASYGQTTPDDDPDAGTDAEAGAVGDASSVPVPDGSEDEDGSYDAGAQDAGLFDSGIDVTTACLVDHDRFVIAGDAFVYSGLPFVIDGPSGWTVQVNGLGSDDLPSYIQIFMDGLNWEADFTTGTSDSLQPGPYTGATRAGFGGGPGLDISGNGRGCNTLTGQFTVLEIDASPGDPASGDNGPILHSFTATFEQDCGGINVGCIHVQQ